MIPLAKLVLAGLAGVAGVAGWHAVNSSVSAGMQPGPVCITQTAHPGQSYTAPVNVTGDTSHESLSVQQIGPPAGPPYPAGGHPLPRSWVSFGGVSQVTINVPGGARPGRYGASLVVTSYGNGGGGSGTHVALGAAAATWLEVSVGVPPPPRAFCTGQRPTYWPPRVQLPLCKGLQAPMRGGQPWCRVLPLAPPGVSAKNCHMSTAAWSQYMGQLRRAARRYAGNPSAYLPDAHCVVGGHTLNRASYYRRTGQFRFSDGAPRFGQGQLQNARPAVSP